MYLITCENLELGYDGVSAVKNLSCRIECGSFLCVLGNNGSGKTTFIRGLLGLIKPISGQIKFNKELKHSDVGYLPQQTTIQKNFPASVREVVLSGRLSRLGASVVYRNRDKQAMRDALKRLKIDALEKASFSELSGGQQQRVFLARALCAAPDGLKILILDEPMNGLDSQVKTELYATLTEFNREQNMTILMITHDIQAAVKYASHILVLDKQQKYFGDTHEFQHTSIGLAMLRDSCGSNCSFCGVELEDL